jgi:hypothetical protein
MKILFIFLFLTFIGPIWILATRQIDFSLHWQTADRSSAQLAPKTDEVVIQVYSARAFNWRGIVSTHVWIAIKPKNKSAYKVYQVIGWLALRGLPPLLVQEDIPDRMWFGQKPKVICEAKGERAEKLIPQIEQAAKDYPYANEYVTWPGPNSNTFVAYVARQVPELHLALPSNAIGKDYLPSPYFFAKAPSNTGYQISILGVFGVMLALKEGLEINILGFVYGFSPLTLTLKLPAIEIGPGTKC